MMKRYGPREQYKITPLERWKESQRECCHQSFLTPKADGCWVLYKDAQIEIERLRLRLQKDAQVVVRLLELGDLRLLASDGSCGGQNAVAALLPAESAELYQACQRIAAMAARR
jgi:hypothetical protein